MVAGVLFALEFLLIYRGLLYTTATRAVLFLYTAPFLVVMGSRWLVQGDHFHLSQWSGMALSFVGIVIAFGLPTPAADPHQMLGDVMMVGAAIAWAATTLVIKASMLNQVTPRRRRFTSSWSPRRFSPSEPRLRRTYRRDALGPGARRLAYQAVWVVSVTFMVWFALIVRYSANRLSAFTFLDPDCLASPPAISSLTSR